MKFSVSHDFAFDTSVGIRMGFHDGDSFHSADHVVFMKRQRGEYIEPCMRLTHEEATRLMNELWRAGIRPTEAMGSVGQLEAVNRHLEDMRTLVFKEKSNG